VVWPRPLSADGGLRDDRYSRAAGVAKAPAIYVY
jgi:hypothetical protein